MSIILGIDPGSRVTGFGVIELGDNHQIKHINHGIIMLGAKDKFSDRIQDLGEAMQEILQKYQPTDVSIEKIFLGKNADSAFKLGHARGVVMYEAARFGASIHEYATRTVKKSVSGTGSADKESVQFMLTRLLGLREIKSLDASDALALAVHHSMQSPPTSQQRVFL